MMDGVKDIFKEVIYFEWQICVLTFLLVSVIDKTKIKKVEIVEEED